MRRATTRSVDSEASPEASSAWAIEVDSMTLVYSPSKGQPVKALEDITFHVPHGQFVSLLGPSGCGKSTLLNVVAGLLKPSGGAVSLSGVPVTRPVTELGLVFQRDLLLPWRSALNNILLQAEIRGMAKQPALARARELLAQIRLSDFEHSLPSELSGGMRQRVAIARGLIHDPSLLLMDEPFGALDALTRDDMNVDLMDLCDQQKTVLFVTHSIDEAVFLSDRVLVMGPRPGRVVEDVEIELPRPRELSVRDSTTFREYAAHIRALINGMRTAADTR